MLEEEVFEFTRLVHCNYRATRTTKTIAGMSEPSPFSLCVCALGLCFNVGEKALTVDQDVAATDEFAVDVDLGDGGPVRVLLDAFAQFLVFEAVERFEEFWFDALDLHDLDHGAREAAHGQIRRSLHKHHQRVRLDGGVDLAACFGGQKTQVRERCKCNWRTRASGTRENRCPCWRRALHEWQTDPHPAKQTNK